MSRWPLHKAYFWQEAPLIRPLLFLIAGVLCYDLGIPAALYFFPAVAALVVSGVLLVAASLSLRANPMASRGYALIAFVFFILLGWCAYASVDGRNRSDWLAADRQPEGPCVVRVLETPRERAATTRLRVELLYTAGISGIRRVSGKALVYIYRKAGGGGFFKGDTLLLRGRWQPIRNSGNPFAFDNVAFQRRRGIHYQQFINPDGVLRISRPDPAATGMLDRAHDWCRRQLDAYLPDSQAAGLLHAMLLGDEQAFDPELREAYAQTGVIHIVSISGAHVAVLFLVVTGLLFWIRGKRGQWIRYAAGLSLVWLYVLMAGAPPSALRSAVMFSVIALSVIAGREGQALNTVAAAAFILLIGCPEWLFSPGFQLSFGAVLSLLIFYTPICRLWPQTAWLPRVTWQAVSASLAAEILTAPLVVFYFHNFPLLFIIANLLSTLLVGLIALIGGMAILAFCWIPPLAALIGNIVIWFITVFNAGITELQGYNPASFQYLKLNAAELILIYIVIAALSICWLQRQAKALLPALFTASLLLIFLCLDKYRALRQDRVVVYAHGRKALVERIRGRHFLPLSSPNEGFYDTKAAHIGWQAWRKAPLDALPLLSVNGSTVFLLKDSLVNDCMSSFPVDVLIICRSLRLLQPARILKHFSPKVVVLAQRPSAYHLRRWRDSCAKHCAYLYNVADAGAYILD